MKMKRFGILLTNVGTPDRPDEASLRDYLAEFLSDKRVIDYPRWLWRPILNGIILKKRPARSAELYNNIWLPEGSPLLIDMESIASKLEEDLNQNSEFQFHIAIGMRYGNPSLLAGIEHLLTKEIDELIVFPLYPQYSISTTGTTLEAVNRILESRPSTISYRAIPEYYQHPKYITALSMSIEKHWQAFGKTNRLLFSFHGVPQRYQKFDQYFDQCSKTANLVAQELSLESGEWEVSFQSRFGPEPWLQPYTDEILEAWGQAGENRVGVIAPGFSVDCLETIDELGREAREIFIHAGGKDFRYIPALNDTHSHINLLSSLILEKL